MHWGPFFPSNLILAGRKFACGTACHTQHESFFVASAVAQKVYALARAGSLQLPGFPSFDQVVTELNTASELKAPEYAVTVALADGTLAIQESLIQQWSGNEMFELEANELIAEHNKKYNPRGVKRGVEENGSEATSQEPSTKRLCVETTAKIAEQEAKIVDKCLCLPPSIFLLPWWWWVQHLFQFSTGIVAFILFGPSDLQTLLCDVWVLLRICLSCGTFRLVYDKELGDLWICPDGRKKDSSVEAKGPTELFGFGSGQFAEGPEAKDIMSDIGGRWLCFNVASGNEHCILESDKRLPEHIRSSDVFGKVACRISFSR